jgi:ATP-binding cassette subfamily B protein RaxB
MISTFLNLSGRRRVPLLRQAEAAECGLASIAMVAAHHGFDVDLTTMRRRFAVSMKGMTLRTMTDVAAEIGLSSRAIRCELPDLVHIRMPAILHWGTNHFVVLVAASSRSLTVHDPAHGSVTLPMADATRKFTGVAVELTPNAAFRRARERNPLKLGTVLSFRPVYAAVVQTVLLSLLIELLVLSAPFYLQLVIDESILKGDFSLLSVLALAFGALLVFRVGALTLRSLSTQYISNVLSFDTKARIFNHLVRLPLDWFHKRQVGDVLSRFSAVRAIQAFVAQGALTGILDGILGTVVLAFLFAYAAGLALIVLVSIGIYLVLRIATFQLSKRFAADVIVTDAREQSRFLETLRAAQTIKSAAGERLRETQYRNVVGASINAQIRSGNINIGYASTEQLLNGLTDVLVVFLGARAVLAGNMTVGVLTAFLAYKAQFVSRFTNFVDQAVSWRLLDLQLERLADIALSPKEERIDSGGYEGQITGRIECRRLSFQYAYGEPTVLSNVSFHVNAGECIAIAGASGCGKSTLAKLISGLYSPTDGDVFIDGRPISKWSKRSLRSQISFVAQDDQLLAGTIAENIASFDEQIAMDHVRGCATLAQVDDEIMAMPMAYESLVGDMGSTLSGGQKQRVLIARALYRNPRILVMDEGTAHLDVDNERDVTTALAALKMTRVVIAHRPETIAAANRAIYLGATKLGDAQAASEEAIKLAAAVGAQ